MLSNVCKEYPLTLLHYHPKYQVGDSMHFRENGVVKLGIVIESLGSGFYFVLIDDGTQRKVLVDIHPDEEAVLEHQD